MLSPRARGIEAKAVQCERQAIQTMRGWRSTVGNLNELFWLRKAGHGLLSADICEKTRGYGFNEFQMSNSTSKLLKS